MRQVLSFGIALLVVNQLNFAAFADANVASQITGMQAGTRIEVHLNDKQTLRGTRGDVSPSGFALADSSGGSRQIAFDQVASVKQIKKSHILRNVLIGVGIAVVALAVAVVIAGPPLGSWN